MAIGFWLRGATGCNSSVAPGETIVKYDSSLAKKYLQNLAKDTAGVKFIEKIVKEYVPAKVVTIQKLDTIKIKELVEVTKKFDVMLKLEKKGFHYSVTAFNQDYGTLKTLEFDVYGDNVTFTSKTGDVHVTSSKFDLKPFTLYYSAGIQTDSLITRRGFNSMTHTLGISKEISYKNTLSLGLAQEYEITQKNLITKLNLKFNF